MDAGDSGATKGMALNIYTALDQALRPPMEKNKVKPEDIKNIQDNWRNLACAFSTGVVQSLVATTPSGTMPAQVVSTATDDAVFWPWLAGFVDVFQNQWVPTTPDGLALQAALKKFIQTSNNPVPTQLKGSLK
jgi:hypothetical protein